MARISDDFHLTAKERTQLTPSDRSSTIANRVAWATTYLKQAGLLERPERGVVRITLRGREVLAGNPSTIDDAFLERFAEFQAFRHRAKRPGRSAVPSAGASKFSKAAVDAANQPGSFRVVLIDGDQLTKLMVRFKVGVRVAETVEIKRIDQDYFDAALPD